MATVSLVQRTRQLIAAEDDDYFQAETIKYYINKSLEKIVAYLIQMERSEPNHSRRGLDMLRTSAMLTVDTPAPTQQTNYWLAYMDLPEDQSQYLYLRYKNATVIREVTSARLHKIQWANLIPTLYESYFYVTSVSGVAKFQIYLYEDPDDNIIELFYVKKPTPIELTDEEFTDVPIQLENAVLYGAAIMMLAQEVGGERGGEASVQNRTLLEGMYEKELQINAY
jgi:hypothetical protein